MRVVIAEDSVLLREGLVRLVEAAGLQVAGTAGDVAGLDALLTEVEADVVVLDVRMPPTFTDEGIRSALALQRREPPLPVLVLSQYVEERYASELLSRGAGGVAAPPLVAVSLVVHQEALGWFRQLGPTPLMANQVVPASVHRRIAMAVMASAWQLPPSVGLSR